MPRQEHSARALFVERENDDGLSGEVADALVTDRPGMVLGVATADCAPILILEPARGLVAAIHAGWRGSLAGIVEATLDLITDHGGEAGRCVAAIGPQLGPESFEVGPEFVERFVVAHAWSQSLFSPGDGDRSLFDHAAFIRARLVRTGVKIVEILAIDTLADTDYFSHRRAQKAGRPDTGRNGSAIVLLE